MDTIPKIAGLFSGGALRRLYLGEVLYTPEDSCRSVGYVRSGRLVMKKYLSNGRELVVSEFLPGSMFGELLVFTGGPYRGWLIAAEASEVIEIERDKLLNLFREKEFLQAFFSEVTQRVSSLAEALELRSLPRVDERVAFYMLSHHSGEEGCNATITELASRLGCSREALSRSVGKLIGVGALERSQGMIHIRRADLLEDLLTGSRKSGI